MKKTQKVGTTTNKKSETIEHQNDFSKRWNINISGNYMALKNRIIVILDGVSFNSYWMPSFERKYSIKLVKDYVDQDYFAIFIFLFKDIFI